VKHAFKYKKFIKSFFRNPEMYFGDRRVDGSIILKWILTKNVKKKYVVDSFGPE
jgi:hypothetical protein